MVLIIEDGTGLIDAESYVSVADADTYIDKYVFDTSAWDGASTGEKEKALRMATQWLDEAFNWKGRKADDDQALSWPRAHVVDSEGYGIDSDTIPGSIKNACSEGAVRALSGELVSDIDAGTGAVEESAVKVGPIEEKVKYVGGAPTQKYFAKIVSLVSGLTANGGGTGLLEVVRG